MRNNIVEKDGVVYKLVPPEGGWGYVMTIPFFTYILLSIVPMQAFGIVYKTFLHEINATASDVGLVQGCFMSVLSIASYLSTIPLKRYSFRQVALVGAAFYVIGAAGGIFMNSVNTLVLCNGIMIPASIGVLLSTTMPAVNTYFEKKRATVVGVCQLIVGIMIVSGPVLYNLSIEQLGFRNTTIVIFAQSLLLLASMVLIRPVDPYLKMEPVSEQELIEVQEKITLKGKMCDYSEIIMKVQDGEIKMTQEDKASCSKQLLNFLGLDIFKDLRFLNICMGIAFALISDFSFATFLPLHLYTIGWSQAEVAYLLSMGEFGDLAGRFGYVFMSRTKVPSRIFFLAAVAASVVLKIGMTYSTSWTPLLVLTIIVGVPRGLVYALQLLVLAEHLPADKLATGVGVNMSIIGIFGVPIGIIVGVLKDITGTYIWSLNILSLILLLCVIPWCIELSCFRKNTKKVPKYP